MAWIHDAGASPTPMEPGSGSYPDAPNAAWTFEDVVTRLSPSKYTTSPRSSLRYATLFAVTAPAENPPTAIVFGLMP